MYNGTDKTFFFFNWESGRLAQGAVSQLRLVPAGLDPHRRFPQPDECAHGRADRAARSSECGSGEQRHSRAASASRRSLSGFHAAAEHQVGTLNFATTAASAVSTQDNYNARIDHNFSSRDPLSGRYIFNDTYEAGVPFWGHDERNNLGRSQNYASTWTHTFGPSLINELRGGWHRFFETEIFGTTNDPAYDIVGKMGLPLVSRLPEEYGPPTITLNGPDGDLPLTTCNARSGRATVPTKSPSSSIRFPGSTESTS